MEVVIADLDDSSQSGRAVLPRTAHGRIARDDELRKMRVLAVDVEVQLRKTVQLAEAAECQASVVDHGVAQQSGDADHSVLRPNVVDVIAAGYSGRYDGSFVGQRITSKNPQLVHCRVIDAAGIVVVVLL